MCAVQFLTPSAIPYLVSNRLLGEQQVGNYEDRYLLRETMGHFRGISIGVVLNNRVRAAATIPYCKTNMIVNVAIDSCLGQ